MTNTSALAPQFIRYALGLVLALTLMFVGVSVQQLRAAGGCASIACLDDKKCIDNECDSCHWDNRCALDPAAD